MRFVPRWTAAQWSGAVLMFLGCVGIGLSGAWLLPVSHAVPSVPITQLGLAVDHAEKAQSVAASLPPFQLIGDAAAEDNSKKNIRLWDAVLQLRGEHLPNVPQQIGDCVSWGAANAVNYLQAVQIIRGPPAEFHPAYPPWIYGAGRVWVGKSHGSNFRGDGLVGAYAAEALQNYGCLRADHPKCPPYDGATARQWGASGPPEWAKEVAKANLVQSIAQVQSAREAMDSIAGAHCPVTIASSWWGTTDIPVVNGRRVAKRTTAWAHQQCLIAYDGSGAEPLFYCLNSWGPNAHPAPLQGEPPGGYWIRWRDVDRICSEGDSWAISSFDGFPAAGPNWDELLRRPATSPVTITRDGSNGSNGLNGGHEMRYLLESPGTLLAFCCLVALGGLILFVMARQRDKVARTALMTLLTLTAMATASTAVPSALGQDFAAAATRGTPSPVAVVTPVTATTPADDDPMGWRVAATRSIADPLTAGCQDVVTEGPQALVFVMERGCSDCDKLVSYVRKELVPKGWIESDKPDADFRIIDIRKNPEIARLYGVEMVPTVVYTNRYGRIVERRVGFQAGQQWVAPLLSCR